MANFIYRAPLNNTALHLGIISAVLIRLYIATSRLHIAYGTIDASQSLHSS